MSTSTTHNDTAVSSKSLSVLDRYRERLANSIADSYNNNRNVLIESLPITGKSYSTFKQASETDTQILYLTSLNRLKEEAERKCEKFGLSYYRIPVPHDECPSFKNNKHGLNDLYRRGISGKELHDRLDLPCGDSCPYMQELGKDVSDYDVLIGNPKHAYNDRYLQDRIVVKDEFSEGEYEIVHENPRELVNRFVQSVETFPLNSFTEIRNERSTSEGARAKRWFQEHDVYRDTETALDRRKYHVHAPLLTYSLLAGIEVNSNWEKTHTQFSEVFEIDTHIGDNAQVVFDSEREMMYVLNPPEFESADGFVGLDGTPIPEMWEVATGLELDHMQVLSPSERKGYISNTLNLEIIELTDSKKYYQGMGHISAEEDTGIAYSILQSEGERPGLITSKKALRDYPAEISEYIDGSINFAKVLSSNQFEEKQLGLVTGMRNYGDEYLIKWGCYLNKDVSIDREEGEETVYQFGEDSFNIFPLYRNLTLQDVFRFGRNDSPTKVYVNTSGLPDWVPTEEGTLPDYTESERGILNYLSEVGGKGASCKEITDNMDMSKRIVQYKVNNLQGRGLIEEHNFSSKPIYTLNN